MIYRFILSVHSQVSAEMSCTRYERNWSMTKKNLREASFTLGQHHLSPRCNERGRGFAGMITISHSSKYFLIAISD